MKDSLIKSVLLKHNLGVMDCEIGFNLAKNHSNLLSKIGFGDKSVFLISDKNIYDNCQKLFNNLENIIPSWTLILDNPKANDITLSFIESRIKELPEIPDLILSIGSGTVNDLSKLVSYHLKIPYVIFASAASMNGYLSKNASILINGHKKTLAATLPVAIYVDLDVVKSAPESLTKAGIADSLCFYSCWFDWYLASLILKTKFNTNCFLTLQPEIDYLINNYQKFSLTDDIFLGRLMEILLITGLNMTISGGSHPASQSEHLIAHLLEMKYKNEMSGIFHGLQIAVTTLTSAKIQEKILSTNTLKVEKSVSMSLNDDVYKFFGDSLFKECKQEFLKKEITEEMAEEISADLITNWTIYKEDLSKIHLSCEKLMKIFQHFNINTSYEAFGISKNQYLEVVRSAKFIRDRFTCLDLF